MVVRDGRAALFTRLDSRRRLLDAGGAVRDHPQRSPATTRARSESSYKPMYFYGGYAIHGNPSVPPYPASHGCVRVPNFVADRLYNTQGYGEAVIIY